MYHIDFNKPEHIHFIGIGGISMSGLAEILLERGFTVSGSDAHESLLYIQRQSTRITRSTRRQRRRICRSFPEQSFSDSS